VITLPTRAVQVWVPPSERPEALQETARKAEVAKVRAAELAARAAVAARRQRQADIHEAGEKLVLHHLQKLQRLSEHEDFKNAPGPVDLKDIIKLAELVGKDFRLDTGQSTENIAHAVSATIDFAKMSQEERDQWRALAIKGGADID
jgi:hypothetical protein